MARPDSQRSGAPLLVTGFGSFEQVQVNPSGLVARALDGARLEPGHVVVGRTLPVSFARAGRALEGLLDECGRAPLLVLALGVQRQASFRPEARAGTELDLERPDSDGATSHSAQLERGRAPLVTSFDLARVEGVLRACGVSAIDLSEDAGGYVCECVYRHVLEYSRSSSVPGLFLHLPPLADVDLETQLGVVRAVLADLVEQAHAGA